MIEVLEAGGRLLVILGAALLATVALTLTLRAVVPDEVIPVRTSHGVTWAGDQCRIRPDGALECRGKIG